MLNQLERIATTKKAKNIKIVLWIILGFVLMAWNEYSMMNGGL